MANPAAMLALSEIRKREMNKYMENMSFAAKIKAAAQAAAASLNKVVHWFLIIGVK